MPLQNRVTPFGDLIADSARGLFMGNRGGRIHHEQQTLTARRWASRQWICCALNFKGRGRNVWGNSYTELFFLDEVTALAVGHRPCFECRRADALAFAAAWQRTGGHRPRAADMDAVLHGERLSGGKKRTYRRSIADLPDATMIAIDGVAFAVHGDALLRWSPAGYGEVLPRRDTLCDVLTPASIVAALARGYRPRWHDSADLALARPVA